MADPTTNLPASLSSEDIHERGEVCSVIDNPKREDSVPIAANAQDRDDIISEHSSKNSFECLERLEDDTEVNELTDSEDIKGAVIISTVGQTRADVKEPFIESQELGKNSDHRFRSQNELLLTFLDTPKIENTFNTRDFEIDSIKDPEKLVLVAASHVCNGPVGLNKLTEYYDFDHNKFRTSVRQLFKNPNSVTHSNWLKFLQLVKRSIPEEIDTPMKLKYNENYPCQEFMKSHPNLKFC